MTSYFGVNMDQMLNSPAFNDFTSRFVHPVWRPLQNFSRTNPTISYWKSLLQGKIGRNSNPLHPAIVHAPVVLLPLALLFDWLVFVPGLTCTYSARVAVLTVYCRDTWSSPFSVPCVFILFESACMHHRNSSSRYFVV